MEHTHHKELKNFYISFSLYNFAISLVQFFIPLYLYGKSFSISSIIFFYALMQVGRLMALPMSVYFSSLYGAKKMISVAFVFSIISFYLLQSVDVSSDSFLISAIIYGSVWAFLWPPYLVHQSKISPNENRGRISGKISMYSALASSFGPLLGGFVIAGYGFSYSFAIAILLTIPAIYLLLLTPEVSKIRKINYSLISKIYPDMIANGFYNIQNFLNDTIWPIFIFVLIPQYKTIGSMQTAALLVSVLSYYIIGVWTDKFNRTKLLALGSYAACGVGLLRLLANSFFGVFLLNIFFASSRTLEAIPWNAKIQEHLDEDARTEYIAAFEFGGALVTLIGLAVLSYLFSLMPLNESLILGLIVASVSGLFVNFMRK
jgi:MFS family permease